MELDRVELFLNHVEEYGDLDGDGIAKALSEIIRCKTVSYEDASLMEGAEFLKLHSSVEESFPLVHKTLEKKIINDWTLLYKWQGSDEALEPALFMAHMDVVPVMPGTEQDWEQDAFGGIIKDGLIWGRGAVDTKSLIVGELAAVEYLIGKGQQPKRTVYLMFGHDEETMGKNGSFAAKEYLEKQGIRLAFVMDEGGGFKMGDMFGAPGKLMAEIDIFEKGYVDIAVEVKAQGGHSSKPGKGTALGKAAKAMVAIEENQFAPKVSGLLMEMLQGMDAAITEEPLKTYVADLEANKEKLAEYMLNTTSLAPYVQTTTALTMMEGSPAPNVLPQKARGIVNFRICEGDTCESVLQHCKDVVQMPEVEISIVKGMNPSKVSDSKGIGFQAIKGAAEKFFKDITVFPGMMVGGTDCKYYEDISDCCCRFRPFIDNMPLGYTTHATNERCMISGLIHGAKVIIEVMVRSCF